MTAIGCQCLVLLVCFHFSRIWKVLFSSPVSLYYCSVFPSFRFLEIINLNVFWSMWRCGWEWFSMFGFVSPLRTQNSSQKLSTLKLFQFSNSNFMVEIIFLMIYSFMKIYENYILSWITLFFRAILSHDSPIFHRFLAMIRRFLAMIRRFFADI